MSEEEENNASQPPKKPKVLGIFPATSDAGLWWKKASTWLAAAAALIGAYCGASLAAFALSPEEAKAAVSASELAWYARGTMISAGIAALIPLATSIKQQGLQR